MHDIFQPARVRGLDSPFCADYKIDLILGRHDGLKNHASPLCETLLTPFIAVIGGLQHSILVIQIAEIVYRNIIGIDLLRIFEPLVVKNFGGKSSIP